MTTSSSITDTSAFLAPATPGPFTVIPHCAANTLTLEGYIREQLIRRAFTGTRNGADLRGITPR